MERLFQLEAEARKLEFEQESRYQLQQAVFLYANQFLDALPEKKAFQKEEGQSLQLLDFEIPEEGRPINKVLEVIDQSVDQTGINPASGNHLGYIHGGGLYPTALGDYLAAVSNRYAGMFFASPGAVRMENFLLRWLCQMVGFPETAMGNLTSGGSIANLIAVTTARDKMEIVGDKIGKSTVYLTHQVHHCVQKALRIAGLGAAIIRYIPIDDRFRMQPEALNAQVKRDKADGLQPFLLVGSAGTTNTGAIDPLDALAEVAKQYGMWFHVDAAYGGAFLLVEKLRPAFAGIERSDSVTIDPHKGFFLSYGVGALLMKDMDALYQSQYYSAGYMQDAEENSQDWSPSDLSPELTKHFRGLRMWLPLQLFGLNPLRAALEEKVLLTQYFYEKIQEIGFEVGPYPQLSVLLFRYVGQFDDPNPFNRSLVHWLQEDGTFFFSSTTIDGQYFLRLAVLSFRTHLQHIDHALRLLKKGLQELMAVQDLPK